MVQRPSGCHIRLASFPATRAAGPTARPTAAAFSPCRARHPRARAGSAVAASVATVAAPEIIQATTQPAAQREAIASPSSSPAVSHQKADIAATWPASIAPGRPAGPAPPARASSSRSLRPPKSIVAEAAAIPVATPRSERARIHEIQPARGSSHPIAQTIAFADLPVSESPSNRAFNDPVSNRADQKNLQEQQGRRRSEPEGIRPRT